MRAGLLTTAIVLASANFAAGQVTLWEVDPDPSIVIGVNESLPGHSLFRVMSALRLSDGRIVIADGGSSEVRFYSSTGTFLGKAGRQGRGPDEFRFIRDMVALPGDTLLVFSLDPARAWISPEMEVVRKVPIGVEHLQVRCRIAESGVTLLPDGSLLIQAEDNRGISGCLPREHGVHQNTDLLARFDPARNRVDTLGIFPGTERDSIRFRPFGRLLANAASSDRIFAGETGGDTITVFSYTGERIDTWHVPLEPRPVPRSVRAKQPDARRLPDGSVRRPWSWHYPDFYPRFGRLLVDAAGNLWVMRYPELDEPVASYRLTTTSSTPTMDPAGAEWIVLDRDGRMIAAVRTPPGLYPLQVGRDYVLGVARNDLDVESVRLHRLRR